MGPDLISLEEARWKLARLWFVLSGMLFLILIGQSIGGVYGDALQSAWSWALPNFLPTLALMISVFAADALLPFDPARQTQVRRQFYKLSIWLSAFYLVILLISILAIPLVLTASVAGDSAPTPIKWLQLSNLWLAPLQGLVVAALGVLFFLKEDKRPGVQKPAGGP